MEKRPIRTGTRLTAALIPFLEFFLFFIFRDESYNWPEQGVKKNALLGKL